MAIIYSPDSPYAKELARWEQHKTKICYDTDTEPGNPYTYREYPRMLYKARRKNGVPMVIDPQDEQWSAGNYTIVNDDLEKSRQIEAGWRMTQQEALDLMESRDRQTSTAAAERAYSDSRMSEAAQREAAQADAASPEHVAEVPVKRRGRPRKVQPAA